MDEFPDETAAADSSRAFDGSQKKKNDTGDTSPLRLLMNPKTLHSHKNYGFYSFNSFEKSAPRVIIFTEMVSQHIWERL